jgi:hypothetical protein
MSSSKESESQRLKFLLLLQNGIPVENLAVIPPPRKQTTVSQKILDENMAKAYPEFSRHDWGPFGKYEYLGAGTPYTQKRRAGIEPRNDLDKIAMYHDAGYSSYEGGSAAQRALIRSYHDLGAGSAMVTAGLNPWSDAPLVLSVLSGAALIGQGLARIHPLTFVPMAIIDAVAYGGTKMDPDIGDARELLLAL